jgi:SAM-dependent methyltransferase
MSWREFWNRENSIYVNDRHRALHDDMVAKGIAGLVRAPTDIVLDYGCGDASVADFVADRCGKLYLFDAAPTVRARLKERFGGRDKFAVLEEEGLVAIADGALDLIVVNSVLQYVPKRDFETLLDRFRVKLKPTGRLVLADIIAPDASALGDIEALLSFAFKGGFFFAACAGLVTTFFSDYRKLRAQYGLTRYDAVEMIGLLCAHRFVAACAPRNIGHNQTRMMFEASPAP